MREERCSFPSLPPPAPHASFLLLSRLQACRERMQYDLCKECAAKSGLCGPAAREDPEGLSLLPDEKRVLDSMVRATNLTRQRRPFRHDPTSPPKLAYVVRKQTPPSVMNLSTHLLLLLLLL